MEDSLNIIGYGKPCIGCKKCEHYKKNECRGMKQICFGFKETKFIQLKERK